MASDTRNVKLGVCKVFYDGNDLGYTQGGVEFSVNTMTHKVNVDQFGKTTINETIIGRECTIKTPFAETTLQNMQALLPNLSLTLEGSLIQRLGVDTGIGVSLLETAKMLTLHPINKKDWDFSDEVIVPITNTPGQLTFAYDLEKERIFNTEFIGYPDPASGALFYAGNPFTDAPNKTFTITTATGSVVTGTGFTAGMTGKMAMLGVIDSSSVLGAGLLPRKLYYVKFVSATTVSLHNSYLDAIAGTGAVAITGAGTGTGQRLTVLN